MLLTAVLILKKVKPIIPAVVLLVPSVPYFAATLTWYGVSTLLPARWFRYVDDIMYETYQRFVLFIFENISSVDVTFHGDVDACLSDNRIPENVLYIANHQCTVDWAVADMIAARQRGQRCALGYLRYILKDTLQYVPLYGWYFYHHGCVYVRRGGGKFRSDITCKQLDHLAEMTDKAPVWLVVFPEGTRYSPSNANVLERSRRYAEERGRQPLNQVLTPRVKGVHLALERLLIGKKKLDAVYDVTVAYGRSPNGQRRPEAPSMFDFVCGLSSRRLDVHISRIPIENVPSTEAERDLWLYELFAQKERLLSRYYEASVFDDLIFPGQHRAVDAVPLSFTLPATFLFTSVTLCLLRWNFGRKAYLFTLCFGSLGGILYMKLKKAA